MNYPIQWITTQDGLVPHYIDQQGVLVPAVWAPQKGSQCAFLAATPIFEVLYESGRGVGKTDTLLFDFAQHVGKGWGEEWKGVIFRQSYPQLSDVIQKSQTWFRQAFPGAAYNKQEHKWTFPGGETLMFRHMDDPEDYWNYHGHSFPWIAFEELCNWHNDECYKRMMSCCRSSKVGMPRCYRSTANPFGSGHNWIKNRWKLPSGRGKILIDEESGHTRTAVHGELSENKVLLHADPTYLNKLRAAARCPAELLAWTKGSWDITSGGMLDDLFDRKYHVVPSVPLHKIPRRWKMDRSYDHGSSKPFAALWWAESNGEPFEHNGRVYGRVPGDIYLIQEWYGWSGKRNEGLRMDSGDIADGIKDREADWGVKGRIEPGPADNSIWTEEDGHCPGKTMEAHGVEWERSDKSGGSRKAGWDAIRSLLRGALPVPGALRERPGLFVFDQCEQWLATVPCLPRSAVNPDDVDTKAEDHCGDASRYRLRPTLPEIEQRDL